MCQIPEKYQMPVGSWQLPWNLPRIPFSLHLLFPNPNQVRAFFDKFYGLFMT